MPDQEPKRARVVFVMAALIAVPAGIAETTGFSLRDILPSGEERSGHASATATPSSAAEASTLPPQPPEGSEGELTATEPGPSTEASTPASKFLVEAQRVAGYASHVGGTSIAGHPFPSSIGMHLGSCGSESISYAVEDQFETLAVTLGHSDDSLRTDSIVYFEIRSPSESLASETLAFGEQKELAVDIADVSRVELRAEQVSGRQGRCANTLAVFAAPRLG